MPLLRHVPKILYTALIAGLYMAPGGGATEVVVPSASVATIEPATARDTAATVTYRLLADSSRVEAHTTASGLLGFAGHEHTIAVTRLEGELVVDPEDLTRFSLAIEVDAEGMHVIDVGEDESTRIRIESNMKEKVLETARFPTITLRGIRFAPEESALDSLRHRGFLTAILTLHGLSCEIAIPLTVDIDPEQLRARGEFTFGHRDFDLKRIKAAGLVNVAETIRIVFDLRGWREAAAP